MDLYGGLLIKGQPGLVGQTPTRQADGSLAWQSVARKTYRWAFAFPFTYLGTAESGTAESATGWTVRRIQQTAAGAVTATLSATGAWVDYSSLSYS